MGIKINVVHKKAEPIGLLSSIEKKFYDYLKERGWDAYLNLPEQEQDKLDNGFFNWWIDNDPISALTFGSDYPLCIKKYYCAHMLLDKEELNLEKWMLKHSAYKKDAAVHQQPSL
jgi:hypothetical protein